MEASPLVHELNRLRNELHVRTSEIKEKAVEIATLERQLKAAESGAQRAESQQEATRDRLLSAQKEAESARRQLVAVQEERDELRRRAETAADGAMRALNKETATMSAKLEAAERAALHTRDLESQVAALRRQLADAQQEADTLLRQQRAAQEEAAEARRALAAQGRELGGATNYLSGVMAELAAAQDSLQTVKQENRVLQEELTRVTGGGKLSARSRSAPAAPGGATTAPQAAAAALTQAAPPIAAAVSGDDGADASVRAALQQALQQLSLRTAEVADLKRQLQAPAAVAEGPPAPQAAPGSAEAPATVPRAAAGPATPDAPAAELPAHSPTKHEAAAAPEAVLSVAPGAVDASTQGAAAPAKPSEPKDATQAPPAVASPPVPPLPALITNQASSCALVDALGEPLPSDLATAHQQIVALQRQAARLRQHLAEAAAAGEGSDDEDEGSEDEDGSERRSRSTRTASTSPPATVTAPRSAPSPAQQAAEERRRNANQGMGSLWFGGQRRQYAEQAASALTKEALADMIDRLVQSRTEQARKPRGRSANSDAANGTTSGGSQDGGRSDRGAGGCNDGALWEEATAMLRSELIRLGQEAARKMEENERLRSEVGELKSARLSAEATAVRLEEMNALSIRVATLKMELAALKAEQDEREDALLGQVAVLQQALARKKKRRSPGKMLRKTWTQAVDSLKHGLQGGAANGAATPLPAPAVDGCAPAGQSRTWGGLRKFGSLGGRGGDKEQA